MSVLTFRPASVARLREAVREVHVSAGLDAPRTGREEPVVIGVTSPNMGDGKTTVAMALAGSLSADFGANVMLVDGDFQTPSIGSEFGIIDQDGLWEVVAGTATLESAAQPISAAGLRVLVSGKSTTNAARLARSRQFVGILNEIKMSNQYVVVDLPASLNNMTAPTLAKRCNGVVIVVNAYKTTASDLERTMHLLNGANVLGVIINRSTTSVPRWLARMLDIKG